MNALEASRDRVREWKASSAAPIPGASVEQGTRAAMVGQGTWAAIAGQGTRAAMAGLPPRPRPKPLWLEPYYIQLIEYLHTEGAKNLNIEKITYKVVQMKFLAINITYQ